MMTTSVYKVVYRNFTESQKVLRLQTAKLIDILFDYGLEDGRYRSSMMWYCRPLIDDAFSPSQIPVFSLASSYF